MAEREQLLIVEDEPTLRKLLGLLLRHEGYEVIETADAFEALSRLASGLRPQMILLDVNLPRLSGLELLAKMRALGRGLEDIPVLLVTALSEAELGGAQGLEVVSKPFRFDELCLRVRRKLAGGRKSNAA